MTLLQEHGIVTVQGLPGPGGRAADDRRRLLKAATGRLTAAAGCRRQPTAADGRRREVATAASLLAASADAPSGALRASVVPMKVLRELVGPAGSASAEPLRAASAARR
ncbi:unnamed protein product, partial [Prorocentrum cordatum]